MRLTYAHRKIADRIMHHPEVYPMLNDDHGAFSQKKAGTEFLKIDHVWLLHPNEYSIFLLTPRTFTMYECHTMIVPEGRGIMAIEAARKAARWFFENCQADKIITYVPFFNRPAKVFARKVGFELEGVCTRSFLKNEILHDQWMLGLERGAKCLL